MSLPLLWEFPFSTVMTSTVTLFSMCTINLVRVQTTSNYCPAY